MGAAYLAALVATTAGAVWWIHDAWDNYQTAKHAYRQALKTYETHGCDTPTRIDPPAQSPAVRLVDWQKESWA